MEPKKTFYVWKCAHCQHRNKEVFNYHWNIPCRCNATWYCSSCGNESYIDFIIRVYPIKDKKDEEYYNIWNC